MVSVDFLPFANDKYPARYATLADESSGKIPIILSVVMGFKRVITR